MNRLLIQFCLGTVLLISCVFTAQVRAQTLISGTRVRVTSAEARIVGSVERSTPDTLRLALGDGHRVAYEWADVDAIEHSMGKRGWAGRGALIGAGVMTAFTVGAIVFDGSGDTLDDDLEDMVLILALPFNAALGAGLGALVGLAWRTEQWTVLPFRQLSSANGSTGLTATLRL